MYIESQKIETITDRHGNDCEIWVVNENWGGRDVVVRGYTIRYSGEARRWLNRNGSPYWKALASARKAVRSN
jgi:hypothetical protein